MRRKKWNANIEIPRFFREKGILENAIGILKKYNCHRYPNGSTALVFLEDFERDFILGA